MKTQGKIMKISAALMVVWMLLSLEWGYAQYPAKQTMPSSRDVVVGIKPAVVPNLPENSGGTPTSESLQGDPGNAYLDAEWQQGLVIMKDGGLVELEQMRYNLLTQQIQFVRNQETQAIANSAEINMIRIADKVFVYEPFVVGGTIQTGYLELVEDGKCRLLRRWSASYRRVDEVSGEETVYRTQTCLLQFEGEVAKEVKPNSAGFCDSFGEYGAELKKMMKDEKLNARNPEHLRSLVAYYNEIAAEEGE